MGWLCGPKPYGKLKDYLDSNWDKEQCRVLDSAIVHRTEYYAAIELLATGEVFCGVYMLKHYMEAGEPHMCRKDMDETAHPYIYNCPERILNLLTETTNPNAITWREKCWETIARRRATNNLIPGTKVKYGTATYTLKEKLKGGSWRAYDEFGYGPWKIRPSQLTHSEILP